MNKEILNARLAIMSGNPVVATFYGEMSEESNLPDVQFNEIFSPGRLDAAIKAGMSLDDVVILMAMTLFYHHYPNIAKMQTLTTVTWTGHITGMGGVN